MDCCKKLVFFSKLGQEMDFFVFPTRDEELLFLLMIDFFYRLKAKVVSAAQEGCYLCFHYWLEVIVERR